MTDATSRTKKRGQKDLRAFFSPNGVRREASVSRKKPKSQSSFLPCPLCGVSFPLHVLEVHASTCNGKDNHFQKETVPSSSSAQLVPGLYLIENFVTPEEEEQILETLDDGSRRDFLPWKPSSFNGSHFGKRWGVHCNLRDRTVTPPENPLPRFVSDILLPRLLAAIREHDIAPATNDRWVPNEANAIDYRRHQNHWLKNHVDNRQLSKEPIANLSLVGDCYMTFRNEKAATKMERKVFLKRRCLQILTGEARYHYSHGIRNADLLSDRRVSLTLRESPLTTGMPGKTN